MRSASAATTPAHDRRNDSRAASTSCLSPRILDRDSASTHASRGDQEGDLVLLLHACAAPPEIAAPVETVEERAPARAPRRPGGAEVVKPAERDPARWGAARCNDGTPFTYTWRR